MLKRLVKRLKRTDGVTCYFWKLDPHVTPSTQYRCARMGMDELSKNVEKTDIIKRRYYKMVCAKPLKPINGRHISPEELVHSSRKAGVHEQVLETGDIICIDGGSYSGMWFVNDIGFISLKMMKWREHRERRTESYY